MSLPTGDEIGKVNNLTLQTTKTRDLVLDFRKSIFWTATLIINSDCVEGSNRSNIWRSLTTITDNLSLSAHFTTVLKKTQQRFHFLRVLRRNNLEEKLLVSFDRVTVKSILTDCITVWYRKCPTADRRAVLRVINSAQRITGHSLPSVDTTASSRCLSRTRNIFRDCFHANHKLFNLLPPLVGATGFTRHRQTDSKSISSPEPSLL